MFLLFGGASLVIALFGFNPVFSPEKKVAGLTTLNPTSTPTPSGPDLRFREPPGSAKALTGRRPTSTPIPKPSKSPKKTSDDSSTGILVYPYKTTNDLLQQINAFRSGKGLAPLTANSETCFFANLRSQEIITSFNHDGFRSRIDSKTLPYPSYSLVAENIAMNSDPNQVVPNWISSPGHNENMSKDTPFGCVVGNGNYYVFEAWKPD